MKKCIQNFIAAETLIYVIFIGMDIFLYTGRLSDLIKYTGILLCLYFAFIHQIRLKKRISFRICGLFLTALADVFLLLLDRYYMMGVIIFCMVQICYALDIGSVKLHVIVIRLAVIALCLLLYYFLCRDWEPFIAATIFYVINLAANIVALFLKRESVCFLCGLILLLCCDICVGISNMPRFISYDIFGIQTFLGVVRFLIWVFYLPSQVFITCSILEEKA